MARIFISYRREDSGDATGRICDRLTNRFGRSNVFIDVDSIPYGVDFRQHLAQAVSRCDVLLAVIGDHWLEVRYGDGPKNGQRRLDDAEDFVRIEIQAALERDIPVVPVLVGHAPMPREEQLPDALKMLAFRNAAEVRPGRDFGDHVDRLVQSLDSRRHALLATGACGLVLLLGLAVFLLWRLWPVPPAPSVALRVLSLDVKHCPTVKGHSDKARLALLGEKTFDTQLGDSVTVDARLSRPAYAFLIAFLPNGKVDVCFPESEDEPPPLTDRPRYPSVSMGYDYRLEEGAGLQVFALVVSSQPLPSFKEWWSQRPGCPWKKSETRSGVVWRADGVDDVEALTEDDPAGKRGKGNEVTGKPPVARLAAWLRQIPEAEGVASLGFAVVPKDKP